MPHNDFTPDETRVRRLLQILDAGIVAPDPDFVRRLRETSTNAFLSAHRQRSEQPRSVVLPASTSNVGAQRLLRMRSLMLACVALLLLFGFLPDSWFPSRGIELGVAFKNLARVSSADIELRTNGNLNRLVVMSDGITDRWRFDYASGNSEIMNGDTGVFVNRRKNTAYPLNGALIEASTDLSERVLTNLNLVTTETQESILRQRPKAVIKEHGIPVLVYRAVVPQNGESVEFEAKVDVATKTLVAASTQNYDANGLLKSASKAQVLALNSEISDERFILSDDTQMVASDQIALIEDVQGLAFMRDSETDEISGTSPRQGAPKFDELAKGMGGLPVVESDNSTAQRFFNGPNSTLNSDYSPPPGSGGIKSALPNAALYPNVQLEAGAYVRSATQNSSQIGKALASGATEDRVAPKSLKAASPRESGLELSKDQAKPGVQEQADSSTARAGAARVQQRSDPGPGNPASKQTAMSTSRSKRPGSEFIEQKVAIQSKLEQPTVPNQSPITSANSVNQVESETLNSERAPDRNNMPFLKPSQSSTQAPVERSRVAGSSAAEVARTSPGKAGVPDMTQPNRAQSAGISVESFTALDKTIVKRQGMPIDPELKQKPALGQSGRLSESPLESLPNKLSGPKSVAGASHINELFEGNAAQQTLPLSQSDIQQGLAGRSSDYSRILLQSQLSRLPRLGTEPSNARSKAQPPSAEPLGMIVLDRNGQSNQLNRRQSVVDPVKDNSVEILPGMSIRTETGSSSVVRTRLANDANLLVGPNSEVVLVKPTEVRLESGECEIKVPEGDQVEVVGPELLFGSNRYRLSNNRTYQARGTVNRVQVNGRQVFRLDKNGIQRLNEDPQWLLEYYENLKRRQQSEVTAKGAVLPADQDSKNEKAVPAQPRMKARAN